MSGQWPEAYPTRAEEILAAGRDARPGLPVPDTAPGVNAPVNGLVNGPVNPGMGPGAGPGAGRGTSVAEPATLAVPVADPVSLAVPVPVAVPVPTVEPAAEPVTVPVSGAREAAGREGGAAGPGAGGRGAGTAARRRGGVDPVKVLLHRHRELCERAVDPLEIAAGLEAHGVTDRTAARFRHRDVFSLAEELYARVPRGAGQGRPGAAGQDVRGHDGPSAADAGPVAGGPAGPPAGRRALAYGLSLLPGTLATGTWLLADGTAAVVTGGALALVALVCCLRAGPLRVAGRAGATAWLWAAALTAGVVCADAVGTEGAPPGAAAGTLTALAFATAPATWCAGLFATRARRRLAASRLLEEFAAGARPLLLGVCALFAAALAGLLALTGGALAAGTALGVLLFLARLLAVHGSPAAARNALGAVCAAEAVLLGAAALGQPVPYAATTGLLGAALLALLGHAAAALSRASAHALR
ncbi:hypothetical protein [Streptomyces sp. NPDC101132]|uniref:hypothetical protein n=1 Tax=Streptomyces sp. NPDC101132 TaxID=3366110 RepID=UPI0037FD4538